MIAQQLLNGLITGSVYALFALGFTLIFGTHKILNLAHGGILMSGAFAAYYAIEAGLPFWPAALFATIFAGLLSYLIDLLAFRRFRARKQIEFAAIISSIGANLVVTSIAQQLSGTRVLTYPFDAFPIQFYRILGLRISSLQIVIAGLVLIILVLLFLYLFKTSFGRQVRAVAGNEDASMLLGVNPDSVYFQTFFISGALAGFAGVLIGLMFNSVHFVMGDPLLLQGFVVVVLGGIGSIPGAVAAALLLGVLQSLAIGYFDSGLTTIITYSLLFMVLLVMPNGLLGTHSVSSVAGRR